MTGCTPTEVDVMRAQARSNPSTVSCPHCGSVMQAARSVADRYVPHYLLEDSFEGLPTGREWRILSVELQCADCFPSGILVEL